jgi:hypothetical protein
MSWFDTDGDGHVAMEEIDKIPLFHRAPQRTQQLLREYHNYHEGNSVLYSLTKSDFTTLVKLPEEEQVRLITKLQARLAPTKRRSLSSKKASKMKKKTNAKGSRLNTNTRNAAKQKQGRKSPPVVETDTGPPMMSSLFRRPNKSKSQSPTSTKAGQNIPDEDSWNIDDKLERMDHLNCAVPTSMRTRLSRSGVQLADPKNDDSMFQKLSTTKVVYTKIWENAHSREDSRNCGSYADLTLPGSDRAHRLSRLTQKKAGWG